MVEHWADPLRGSAGVRRRRPVSPAKRPDGVPQAFTIFNESLMQIPRRLVRGTVAALAAATLAGCDNELPTIIGSDRFPEGSLPTTLEVVLDSDAFLHSATVFDDYSRALDAPFLLAAEGFGGALDAHSLVRWEGFPDTVSVPLAGGSFSNDTAFTYGPGRISTTVVPSASTSPGPARLRLWALAQPWDSASVSWTVAERRDGTVLPWREVGGTRGELLAEALWTPGDTASADSLVFSVDSLTVARIAAEGFPGVLITSETPGSRIRFSSRLVLETAIRGVSRPDTALARTFSVGPQEFVFSPVPPRPDTVYRTGGVTGARTLLRLDLAQRLPGCQNPATDPSCPLVPLREVTLNEASLVLQPLAVPSGFRPLGLTDVRVRRVVETGLGRRATLAESFAVDSIAASRFASAEQAAFAIDLTGALAAVAATDSAVTTIALLTEPEGSQFGYLWFAPRPRLRLVYTLPLRPRLP